MSLPRTLAAIKSANAAAGGCWFSRESMRFFRSKIPAGQVYVGRTGTFFVSSEQFVGSDHVAAPRAYSVRKCAEDGRISTVGKFNEIPTLYLARKAAKTAAEADFAVST